MATASDEPLVAPDDGEKLYGEARNLLCLAESLQDKCEFFEVRMSWIAFIGLFASALIPVAGIYLLLYSWGEPWAVAVLTLLFVSWAVASGNSYILWSRMRRQLRRERRALHAFAALLRDLEQGILGRDNFSALERAEFRIRLSRLDLGPG